jgi:hypothetical protein
MSQPARWWPDPYGRFQQRYFDGSHWTAHVIDNSGTQIVDPLGATVSVPFATPTASAADEPTAATTAATTSTVAASLRTFLDGLGPDARDRPAVRLTIALAGVGGVAAAAGIATAIIGDDADGRPRKIAAAVLVVVIAYALRLGVKTQAELRSAAVGAAAVGIPGLATAITNGDPVGGTLVLAAVLLVAAWALPGMRGRPLLLGAGAVALVFALTTFDNNASSDSQLFDLGAADFIGGKSWLFVIAAVVLLGMVWWLDAHSYYGVGTSLVIAALIATALAVLKVVETLGSTGAAFLIALTGLAVAIVGDHGQRRASTWFGVAVAAIGTISVFAASLTPSSTGDFATTLILAGVALVVIPLVVKRIRESRGSPEEAAPASQ